MDTAPAKPGKGNPTAALRAALADVCTRDFGRLLGRWRQLSRQRQVDPGRLEKLGADIAASAARRAARAASKPALRLDDALPIAARADDIIALIRAHQVIVVAGETGSGKTTQLPKLCLAAGRGEAGLIGCTQPRRLAARSVARRVAEELGTRIGDQVGFQVRFTEQVGEGALVKFMTDGILLAETQSDPWLSAYDTLIVDEAHERSLNIDFLLGYLKRLAARRPDLKIIVTSATIDTARFARHFGDAPVVEVEGRTYPVELRWRPVDVPAPADALVGGALAPTGGSRAQPNAPEANRPRSGPRPLLQGKSRSGASIQQGSVEHVALAIDEITAEDPRGDVLVFLPGEREIRDTHLALSRRQYRHTEVLPLYARLSAADQDRVFKPGPQRRIVLATNVAETSLTVPRIRCVVDTGTARVKRYSQRSQLERLHVEPISQAAADQRKGRCGRIGPGICIRLYDEADYAARPRFTEPELLRSSLANVILRMLSLQLGEVEDFPFLDAPEPRAIADGYRRLAELSAIDADKRLTATGRTLARLPIDVQLARMLVEAECLGCLREVLVAVAFLSTQDPRERPADKRQQADQAHAKFADPKSDVVGVLNLWRAHSEAHEELTQSKLRDWCSRHFLSFMRMREWRELHRQLLLVTRELWPAGSREAGPGTRDPGPVKAVSRTAVSAPGQARKRSRDLSKTTSVKAVTRPPTKSGPGSRVPGPDRPPENLAPELYESIHRSLLSGLPTQVGHKDEKGIFRGTRERKFQVFPGSALAKTPPNWIFAAQIIDIGGRVWGMLCARVEPSWIEQQAAHLVRSACRDAHWSRKRGAVVAWEQVTLFGLTLVERRAVTFRDQDPALAHAIFLREALARCDIDARADFVRANARVLEQAHELEATQRRQGLLKHDDELARFFEGKLPPDLCSGRALDAWYRKAAPTAQAALRWSLADVLEAPSEVDAGAFPAALELDGQRYRLEYRFVPGDAADGVTLHLPLALLNALPAARVEWLVPGLLAEKVAAMIRGLPKALRRNFVPAPEFARAFVEAGKGGQSHFSSPIPAMDFARPSKSDSDPLFPPLADALAAFLKRTTGVDIDAAAFGGVELPAHLSMRLRLHDEQGATLATGRDLQALCAQWQGQARQAFSRKTDVDLAREHVEAWDFDDIPARVHAADGLAAFPALVDLGDAVALRVFERGDEAQAAHAGGVERLLRNALAAEFRRARKQLPVGRTLALQYAPLGSIDGLRDDVVEGGFADLLEQSGLQVRTRTAFEALQSDIARRLFAAAMERFKLAEPVIELQAELAPWLQPPTPGFATAAYDDLRSQRDALLKPGFLREGALPRLAHFPRYLKAMRLRAERLRLDPARDRQRLLQVSPYWREVLQRHAAGERSAELDTLRWLVEEWRVSLFAQELKTAEPVSAKRLARALDALRS